MSLFACPTTSPALHSGELARQLVKRPLSTTKVLQWPGLETRPTLWSCIFVLSLLVAWFGSAGRASAWADGNELKPSFRGPVDVVVLTKQDKSQSSSQATLVATANELSNSISLIDLATGQVLDEQSCGERPMAIAQCGPDQVLVSCMRAGTLERFAIQDGRLVRQAVIAVGFEPLGVVVDPVEQVAFVGLQATGEIARIDLSRNEVLDRFAAGPWPRYLTLSVDRSRLAVGCSGDGTIVVHDAKSGEQLYSETLSGGINIGQLSTSNDGQFIYFPWMIYRSNPITESNIQRGWVLASRLGRIRFDGPAYREAISLDVPRRAVADVHGLATNADESRMVVTSSGTHELLVYRLGDLPFVGAGGPGDLIDRKLLRDNDLFSRIELGGRPLAVRNLDERRFLVANSGLDQLQVVDVVDKQIVQSLPLGPQPSEPAELLVQRGRAIFHDAAYSLDQWYSCASCHLDGGSNARAMDTWNDGTELTPKTVLSLTGVTETGPWTWHGWQGDLRASIHKSFTETMQGKAASEDEVSAMEAYLASLKPTESPFVAVDSQLSDAAVRGKELFHSSEIGCANCHSGQYFTDGEIHDVGLGSADDHYEGYNTPSLVGLYRKVRYLHDGRAKSLERLLTKYHRSDEIGGGGSLNDEQLADLIEYLKSL